MFSGIIEDWGIDFMSKDFNKCISGEIYNSTKFKEGKLIYTSKIENVVLDNSNLCNKIDIKPFINIKTINDSIYILGEISSQFRDYLNFLIDNNNLCKDTYSLDTNQGIINCINF